MTGQATFIAPPNTHACDVSFQKVRLKELPDIRRERRDHRMCSSNGSSKFLTGIGPALQGRLRYLRWKEMTFNSIILNEGLPVQNVEAWSKNFIACGRFHLVVMAIIVLLFGSADPTNWQ